MPGPTLPSTVPLWPCMYLPAHPSCTLTLAGPSLDCPFPSSTIPASPPPGSPSVAQLQGWLSPRALNLASHLSTVRLPGPSLCSFLFFPSLKAKTGFIHMPSMLPGLLGVSQASGGWRSLTLPLLAENHFPSLSLSFPICTAGMKWVLPSGVWLELLEEHT